MKTRNLLFLSLFLFVGLTACNNTEENKKHITLAEPDWDSAKLNNAIVKLIVENVYGYTTEIVTGSSILLHEGVKKGEIDINMEVWTENILPYAKDVAKGELQQLGVNFNDNSSGFYVPRYVIEGDPARNIAAIAPELRTVQDLKKYSHLFPDLENHGKGRIYGSIPGWVADEIMYNKFIYNKLDEQYVYFRPGSEAALAAVLSSAYEKGEPIVGYYWEPTWLLGKYDFVLLDDFPFIDSENYAQGKTICPPMDIAIAGSNKFIKNNLEVVKFLKKYKTSSSLLSEGMAYMQETKANINDTAIWLLKKHDELLIQWLEPDEANIIRKIIAEKPVK